MKKGPDTNGHTGRELTDVSPHAPHGGPSLPPRPGTPADTMSVMHDIDAMLEAHVRFELARLEPATLPATVQADVADALATFANVRLMDVAPPATVRDLLQRILVETPLSEAARTAVGDAAAALHIELQREDVRLSSMVDNDAVDQLVRTIVGMHALHEEVLRQVTESSAYSRLLAYVVYQGVKSFVLTQNVVARRVPGASSLVKLGQRSLQNAAPSLEKGIDAQLTAFVDASIADTVKDSRRFVTTMLDEDTLTAIINEARATSSGHTVAQYTSLVDPADVQSIASALVDIADAARRTPLFSRQLDLAVDRLFEAHGDRTLGGALEAMGISADAVAEALADVLAPSLEEARASGALEARIRGRLEPFYRGYEETMSDAAASAAD